MNMHSRSLLAKNAGTVTSTCLNGWWDFLPVFGEPEDTPPTEGWHDGAILVPSFWTKPKDGVRKKGETFYHVRDPQDFADDDEFLFDAFEYPVAWSKTRTGWLRRSLELEKVRDDRRYFLNLDAVCPRGLVFVNGIRFHEHDHPTLPMSIDVTSALHPGTNELIVLIRDYDRDERGRQKVPTGNWIPCGHSGIWQDVHLIERGSAYIADSTIVTSTREGTISVNGTVVSAESAERTLTLNLRVTRWEKGVSAGSGETVLEMGTAELTIGPDGSAEFALQRGWEDAEWWEPSSPTLYWLVYELSEQGRSVEQCCERFGFREVWLEGPDIMLNDHPIHMFSDWGHKTTPFYYTEGWIRQWFGMIRDGNMNHSRLHTHPHPTLILDIADEEGILITGEAGLHGSGGAQAADCPEYWEAARDHVRRFVARDRNHPCVVMWSVENEMRWNRDKTELTQKELPELRKLFHQIDTTRVAYHEGDTSLWNERELEIVSRHYGKECAGLGWWDQTQPLHSGEMSVYHYAGPNNTLHLGGDAVFASLRAVYEAAALDTAHIVEAGRTMGVCNFGPWNYSCLMNFRMESEETHLSYPDYSVPGVKPLRVAAHASEFEFWKDSPGYRAVFGFDIQSYAFRSFAVIDLSFRSAYFAGDAFVRTVHVINDTPDDVTGELVMWLENDAGIVVKEVVPMDLRRGRQDTAVFDVMFPDEAIGTLEWSVSFVAEGKVHDSWCRGLRIEPMTGRSFCDRLQSNVAVHGPGSVKGTLERLGIRPAYVTDLAHLDALDTPILILEQNTVKAGSAINRDVARFVDEGGRVIVLEQTCSLFPGLAMKDMPVNAAFVRAPHHPVLDDLDDADFAYWGDDPYALPGGNAAVARRLYSKDDGTAMLPLLDAGEGGFGHGSLQQTPLFELQQGAGLVLACQLRITELADRHPVAERILGNLLRRVHEYVPPQASEPLVVAGDDDCKRLAEAARAGGTVVVENASPGQLEAWGKALGLELEAVQSEPVYQGVRVKHDPVLDGISNEDTCGVTTWTYSPATNKDTPVCVTPIAPVAGLEPVLVTPTESCLREHFVEMGKTEPLRAHTASRFLFAEKPDQSVVCGRVRVGKGQVLFNQFTPAEPVHPGLARTHSLFLRNLGLPASGDLLAGECVPAGGASEGFPTACHILRSDSEQIVLEELVSCTIFANERMPSRPILKVGSWVREQDDSGTFHAGHAGRICLYYIIQSGIARKNTDQDIGVPNPEALTFLDLEGTGEAMAVINGKTYDPAPLDMGIGTVSDIDLEAGFNHVLIVWTPASPEDTLSMRWRNIMRQPETAFAFV